MPASRAGFAISAAAKATPEKSAARSAKLKPLPPGSESSGGGYDGPAPEVTP